ncbi:MAG: hypothetical protein ACK5HY_12235 [Parahaliea sp.]
MNHKRKFDPKTGRWIDATTVVPDGTALRVPLEFMDAAQRAVAESVRDLAGDKRTAAYDAWVHSLDPATPCKSDHFHTDRRQPTVDERQTALAEYRQSLSDGTYYQGAR